jgi:hypothetical protein
VAKPLTRRLLVRVAKSKAFLWCAGVGGGVLLIVIIISSVVSAATAPAIAFLNAAAHFFGDSDVDTDAEVSDLLDSCLDSADPKTYLKFISHLPGSMDAEELQSYVLYLNAAPTPPSTSTAPALPSATPSAAPPASTSSTASTGDPPLRRIHHPLEPEHPRPAPHGLTLAHHPPTTPTRRPQPRPERRPRRRPRRARHRPRRRPRRRRVLVRGRQVRYRRLLG